MRLAVHGVGAGPTVVLLHGLFGSARNLGSLQQALAAQLRVVAIDLRNHGDSGHDVVMDYATMAADVLETLEAEGIEQAAVLGHSMGGKVAMRIALQTPDLVRRLIVADIAPVQYPSHFGSYAAAMLQVSPEFSRREADAALLEAIPNPAIRSFLLHNFRSGTGWRIGLPEIEAALPQIESWPDAGGISYTGPTLFVTGERSDYVKAAHRPAIRAMFPKARFIAIREAGHWLHAEQPAAFNATVAAFLQPVAAS